jgi:hypothetical protein
MASKGLSLVASGVFSGVADNDSTFFLLSVLGGYFSWKTGIV